MAATDRSADLALCGKLILYSCGSIVCEPGRLAGMPLFRLLYTSDGEHRIETAEGKGVGQRRSNLQ
jgi:hypothetical protein